MCWVQILDRHQLVRQLLEPVCLILWSVLLSIKSVLPAWKVGPPLNPIYLSRKIFLVLCFHFIHPFFEMWIRPNPPFNCIAICQCGLECNLTSPPSSDSVHSAASDFCLFSNFYCAWFVFFHPPLQLCTNFFASSLVVYSCSNNARSPKHTAGTQWCGCGWRHGEHVKCSLLSPQSKVAHRSLHSCNSPPPPNLVFELWLYITRP